MTDETIIAFPTKKPAPSGPLMTPAEEAAMGPEDMAKKLACIALAQYLVDNASEVDAFICAIKVQNSEGFSLRHYTSPIPLNDFAFLLKSMDTILIEALAEVNY